MIRTVIFDFDGTIALGRGPLDAYAEEVVAMSGDAEFARIVDARLADFDAGVSDAADAYEAVRIAAAERKISSQILGRAYVASREYLGTGKAPVHAPEGLVSFLERLSRHAELALATNSPPTRLDATLVGLGVGHLLSVRYTSVGKPEGLSRIVARALERGPVLSVGDLYANDLEPAAELGADTAYVGPAWEAHASRTTMAAALLEELYAPIESWARG